MTTKVRLAMFILALAVFATASPALAEEVSVSSVKLPTMPATASEWRCSKGQCINPDGWVKTKFTAPKSGEANAFAKSNANGLPSCVSSPTVSCIIGNRFGISITFGTDAMSAGQYGVAKNLPPIFAADGTQVDGALFWFFSQSNPEALIKIVKGCAVNGQWWVFISAGTNVAYNADVVDYSTSTGLGYLNPRDNAAMPVQDTSAFACSAEDNETP